MGMFDDPLPPSMRYPNLQPDPMPPPGDAFMPWRPPFGPASDSGSLGTAARGTMPSLADALRFLHAGEPWPGMALPLGYWPDTTGMPSGATLDGLRGGIPPSSWSPPDMRMLSPAQSPDPLRQIDTTLARIQALLTPDAQGRVAALSAVGSTAPPPSDRSNDAPAASDTIAFEPLKHGFDETNASPDAEDSVGDGDVEDDLDADDVAGPYQVAAAGRQDRPSTAGRGRAKTSVKSQTAKSAPIPGTGFGAQQGRTGMATHYYWNGTPLVTFHGARNYRNNNPGNLRYNNVEDARDHGALNIDRDRFAIFPSYDSGSRAHLDLLQRKYGKHSVDAMVTEYGRDAALSDEENEKQIKIYQDKLADYLKKDAPRRPGDTRELGHDTVLETLTPEQLQGLRRVMETHEGFWRPGNRKVWHPQPGGAWYP